MVRYALLGRYYEGNAENFMCQLHEIVRFTYVYIDTRSHYVTYTGYVGKISESEAQ